MESTKYDSARILDANLLGRVAGKQTFGNKT